MAASTAAPCFTGRQIDQYGTSSVSDKYWDPCHAKHAAAGMAGGKEAIISPRASSAWSTQDGYAHIVDPERDTSLEDVGCAPWSAAAAAGFHHALGHDQDCAEATSRSKQEQQQQGAKLFGDDGAGTRSHGQQAAHNDAAAHSDTSRIKLQQPVSPAEQQRQRAARQLEDLLAMIRNEQGTERELCPGCGFLEQQDAAIEQPITPQMLMIVSSWLAEVAFEFSMQQETLFLAVGLLGRFLDASTGVPRGVLQLVAVACMMLAAKQDEVVHPTVRELTDIAANCFTTQDLLRMERILLDSLSWRVKTPTAYTFLHLFTQSTAAMRAAGGVLACSSVAPAAPAPGTPGPKDGPLAGEVVAKAAYLTELALLDYGMLDFRPSKVAASALLLAQSWSQQGAAVAEMQAISGFTAADLQSCMARLVRLHQYAEAAESCESLTPLVFIKDKYAQDCWLKASLQAVPNNNNNAQGAQGAPAESGAIASVQEHSAGAAALPSSSALPSHDGVQPMDL